MALTATYDPVLSRIQLSATLLGGTATYATFDRTINGGVTYTTVRGGATATVTSQTASIDDYEFPPGVSITYRVRSFNASSVMVTGFSTTITQDIDDVWLKVPAAPFLNQPVRVYDRSELTRRSRAGLFDVVGRTLPVMVGDVSSSLSYTLQLLTETPGEESDLDFLFASGEVVYVQLPSTVGYIPGGYFAHVGNVSRAPVSKVSDSRIWTISLTEVAQPGASVVGSAYTWTSALNDFATWTDLLAANADWNTLLDRTGTPSDVIVP